MDKIQQEGNMGETSMNSVSNGNEKNDLWSWILRASEDSSHADLYGDSEEFRNERKAGSGNLIPEKNVTYLLEFNQLESALIRKVRNTVSAEEFDVFKNILQKVRQQGLDHVKDVINNLSEQHTLVKYATQGGDE